MHLLLASLGVPYSSLLSGVPGTSCLSVPYYSLLSGVPGVSGPGVQRCETAPCVCLLAVSVQASNVDTFIVFRSCTPILVALADFFFRGQPWPSATTFGSLFVILAGAVGYVAVEKGLTLKAYAWAVAYLCAITLDMVYLKHVITEVKLNTWGLVLYNNLLALLLFPFFFYLTGEYVEASPLLHWGQWSVGQVFPILLSCAFGIAISFFAMACRMAVSATAFTVLGVTNKFITVTINVTMWDKHASPLGILCLCLTIFGGALYQQSTVRPPPAQGSLPPDPEKAKLLEPIDEGDEREEEEEVEEQEEEAGKGKGKTEGGVAECEGTVKTGSS